MTPFAVFEHAARQELILHVIALAQNLPVGEERCATVPSPLVATSDPPFVAPAADVPGGGWVWDGFAGAGARGDVADVRHEIDKGGERAARRSLARVPHLDHAIVVARGDEITVEDRDAVHRGLVRVGETREGLARGDVRREDAAVGAARQEERAVVDESESAARAVVALDVLQAARRGLVRVMIPNLHLRRRAGRGDEGGNRSARGVGGTAPRVFSSAPRVGGGATGDA